MNTELRTIYDVYSSRQRQQPWGWGQLQHSTALTSAQLWELVRECGITEPDCSLAHINTALAQVRRCTNHNVVCPVRHIWPCLPEGSCCTALQTLAATLLSFSVCIQKVHLWDSRQLFKLLFSKMLSKAADQMQPFICISRSPFSGAQHYLTLTGIP